MKYIHHRPPHKSRGQALFLILIIVLLILFLAVGVWFEQRQHNQERAVAQQDVGMLKRVSYQGKTYLERPAITSILLMGVDQTGEKISYGARQGGQADFLLLAVIDHHDKKIHQLQIDRDTMAEVETLGILGNPIGTRNMQICLSHAFGMTAEENCIYTKNAVERLLEGIKLDYYFALNMDGIGVLNDALGGIIVTLEDDFSDIDPQMTQGSTIQLNASQAEILLRSRMTIGDGTNHARMHRQQTFMRAAADQFKQNLSEDVGFMDKLFDQLDAYITTNVSRGRLANEANQAYHYEIMPVQMIKGEYGIGEDGFVEFYADQDATSKWVIDTFFK